MMSPLLMILLAPAMGVMLLLWLPRQEIRLIRRVAVGATFIPLLTALWVVTNFDRSSGGYQFHVEVPWIAALGVGFHLGVDGISAVLVLLHAICAFAGVLISYAIKERVKEYYLFYLLLITGVFGVFLSLDLFFFYFFYEMAVIPMYPLIGVWGSDTKEGGRVVFSKEYAAMKLTIYLTSGAVLALIGLLWLYVSCGAQTFDVVALEEHLRAHPLDARLQWWIFPLLAVGFGVIAPLWPLHSWSPIGHAAAPSAVSMLHAGVLMKLGSYAIIRLPLNLLPLGAQAWLPWIAGLCTMNIIYGGFVAMAQQDLKFINDTPNYLLMIAEEEANMEAVIRFYGEDDGRSVELFGPYTHSNQTDEVVAAVGSLGSGMIAWKYRITRPDGTVEEKWLKSTYFSPVRQQ